MQNRSQVDRQKEEEEKRLVGRVQMPQSTQRTEKSQRRQEELPLEGEDAALKNRRQTSRLLQKKKKESHMDMTKSADNTPLMLGALRHRKQAVCHRVGSRKEPKAWQMEAEVRAEQKTRPLQAAEARQGAEGVEAVAPHIRPSRQTAEFFAIFSQKTTLTRPYHTPATQAD